MRERDENPVALSAIAATALVLAALAWATPAVVVAVWESQTPRCSAARAVVGTVRIISEGRWSDPRSAYPARVRAQMPDARRWWITVGVFAAIVLATAVVVWRRVEPQVARDRLGRRPYDWRGARPRSWARRRDLSELSSRRNRCGFTIGNVDGRQLRTDDEAHIAVIAPTRSGKTTRCVIPWLLEHPGPAIVTSTKRDVLDATRGWRERHGRVWIYDPFSQDSAAWDPLDGCGEWSYALRQAQWLADATQDNDSEVANYWRGEAAKLLAPLMHAAVLGEGAIDVVIGWLDGQETKEPAHVLRSHRADAAARQLRSVVSLDPRNRGTTYMSAGSVLAAYRYPEVLARSGRGVSASAFFDGAPNTLYIVAADRDQRLLAPLVVALISSLLHSAAERASSEGPLSPTLRVLVEAANVAPVRELPRFLSQAAGHGVRIATIWQSLGQLQERYGGAADTILANSTSKLFMGPITDEATRRYLVDLLGDVRRERASERARRPKATAGGLQQLDGDRALLVSGSAPPAVIATAPWWRVRRLRRRAQRASAPPAP
ncbi:MAG TPA: type IV secretory system conjugative DNA transfer family protein [Solirubrobacteraceae bacterium]|jgi:type IV secretory pathway TraG/TraD family ATPase VirD4